MCPHTAVGHLASDASKAKYPPSTHQILTVATAPPGKFRDEVSPIINKAVDLPPSLKDIFDLKVEKINLKPNLKDLEQIILDHQ
jgi:threonine synthase